MDIIFRNSGSELLQQVIDGIRPPEPSELEAREARRQAKIRQDVEANIMAVYGTNQDSIRIVHEAIFQIGSDLNAAKRLNAALTKMLANLQTSDADGAAK